MKFFLRNPRVIGALMALAATTLVAKASGQYGARVHFIAAITSSQSMVNGEVTERTDTGFTVLSKASELTKILVATDTSITKGAVTIHLTDLAVGDKVSATVMRGADGKLVAVNVRVHTGGE